MILTIALVVYNEEKHLSLIQGNLSVIQKFKSKINVIIIDNASTDSTFQHLERLQKEFSFHLLRRTSNNMGGARAQAILTTSTSWIAFLDADCSINEKWLETALSFISGGDSMQINQSVAALGGSWLPAGPSQQLFCDLFSVFSLHFKMPQIDAKGRSRYVKHLPTACVLYRTQNIIEAGNFDSKYSRVGEDLDMSYRLLSRSKKLQYIPELSFDHSMPTSLNNWFYKIFIYGQARMRVALQYSDLFAPTYILPLVFLLFFLLNAVFINRLHSWPIQFYLLAVFALCLIRTPSLRVLKVFTYVVATHLAYSLGMTAMLLKVFFYKTFKASQATPESIS